MRIARTAARILGRHSASATLVCAEVEPGKIVEAARRASSGGALLYVLLPLHLLLFATTGRLHAAQDVDVLIRPPPTLKGLPPVRFLRDEGDLAILEFPGNYNRFTNSGEPNADPRIAVTREYLQHHPDAYDFLIVFTTFEFDTSDAAAFYLGVHNDTEGIGREFFDHRAAFASQTLQGYIDMAALTRHELDSLAPAFDGTLDLLLHEVMHRWGVAVEFIDEAGQRSAELLGQHDIHWGYFVDSDASVMYGADWRDNIDGSFTAINTRRGYSPVDLYLAGFLPPQAVPNFFTIDSANGDPDALPADIGASASGVARPIAISQIIAAEGDRIPSTDTAQHQFRAGFLLLTLPGEEVSSLTVARLRGLRAEFQRRFRVETRGLGLMHVGPPSPVTVQPSDPEILPTPDPSEGPADLHAAAAWLLSRQLPNGGWVDKAATMVRDTAVARKALLLMDTGVAEASQASLLLRLLTPRNHDERAWLLWSGALSGADQIRTINSLLEERNTDGGWGFQATLGSSPPDTALAILGLRAQGLLAGGLDAGTADFVIDAASGGGGWGAATSGPPHTASNAMMLRALAGLPIDPGAISAALNALLQRQAPDGGFGASHETSQSVAALGLYADQVPADVIGRAVTALQSRQGIDGSWDGSVHATALAILALRNFDRPNLELLPELTFEPSQPVAGEPVSVSFTVRNNGIIATPATTAIALADEPPAGAPLSDPIAVPALAGGESFAGVLVVDTIGLSGAQRLYLWIDAAEVIAESSESDNARALEFSVTDIGDEADIAVTPGTLSVNPQIISRLPSPIRVDVQIRNLSTLQHDRVAVALLLQQDSGDVELTRIEENFAAGQSRVVRLEGSIDSAGSSAHLRIVADADDAIIERNENNNQLAFEVPTGDALDLLIQTQDLVVASPNPTLGQDVAIEVIARNAGTVDAPPALLRLTVEQGAETQTVAEVTLQLGAGEAASRSFLWRAALAGEVLLRATIDPEGLIAEGDESNNAATLPLTVADVGQPNLTIAADRIAFDPDPALEGRPLEIAFTVENRSTVAAGAFSVDVYDGVPGSGGQLLQSLAFDGLAAAAALDGWAQAPPPAGGGERLYFIAIDAAEQVAEFDETDNTAFRTIQVRRLPDLSIAPTSIHLDPAVPVAGAAVTASIDVDNLGQQPAEQIVVKVSEVDRHGTAVAVVEGVVPVIIPGGSETLDLSWNFGQAAGGPERLRVSVDEADRIAEISAANNVAEVVLANPNREFFVTERYFSPNGDGAKDATTIAFEFAGGGNFELQVSDGQGRLVRDFPVPPGVRQGQIVWDGRDRRGVVVRDGDYAVELLEAGDIRGRALVSVDTNRLPVLDAWGTDAAYFTDLRCAVRDLRLPRFSADGRHLLTDRITELDGSQRTGLYRVATRGAAVETLIAQSWWDAIGRAPFIEAFEPLADGRIVFSAYGRLYLLEAPLATPLPLDTGSLPSFDLLVADGEAVLIELDSGPERYWLISLNPAVAPLRVVTPSRTMTFGQPVRGGWLMLDRGNEIFNDEPRFVDRLWLVPADPGKSAELLNAGPDSVEWSASADGRYLVSVAQEKPWERFSRDPGSYARLRFARIDGGEADPVFEREYVSARRGELAATLSPDNRLLVLNGPERRAEVYDVSGRLTAELPLPGQLFSDYAADFGAPESFVFGRWFDGAAAEQAVVWSSDRDQFLVEFALHLLNDSDSKAGAKTVPGSATHVGLLLGGDLDELSLEPIGSINYAAADSVIFPGQIELPEADELRWLPRTDQLLARPRVGGSPWTLHPGQPATVNDLGSGPIDLLWPARPGAPVTRLYLPAYQAGADTFRCAGAGVPELIFESSDNLIAHLEAGRFASAVELRGVAADRHLLSHRLEWAYADDPERWFALTSPAEGPVIDGLFATWVPPQPGNFQVRLTVIDRAGNSRQAVRSVAWLAPASLADVRLEPTYISPNGDALQDVAVLSFRVLEPLNLDATIENESGAVVRVLSGQYPLVNGVIESLSWDGRDGNGQWVAEGDYLLRLLNRRFRVTVDITAPAVEVKFRPLLGAGNPPCGLQRPERCIEVAVADANLASSVLEYQTASQAYSELAPVAAGRTFVIGRDAPAAPVPEVTVKRVPIRIPYAEARVRISVADLAGNSRRAEASKPSEELAAIQVLTAGDGSTGLHLETSIVASVDRYYLEYWDPVAEAWVSREKPPLAGDELVPFKLPAISPGAARYRPVLALDLRQDLPAVNSVRLRASAVVGTRTLRSNELIFANPFGRLLRLEAEDGVAGLLRELDAEAPEAARLLRDLWRSFPASGAALSRALLVAELPAQQPSLLQVSSAADPHYAGSRLFTPRGSAVSGPYYAAIFHFPTAPCASYQLVWQGGVDQDNRPNSAATGHHRSCLALTAGISLVAGEFCSRVASGRAELSASVASGDPQVIPAALNVYRIGAGRELLVGNVIAPEIDREYLFSIDSSGVPEGQLQYLVEAADSAGDRARRMLLLPVDKNPVSVAIDYPPEGALVCGEIDTGGAISVPIFGAVRDQALFRYRVSLAPGHDSGEFEVIGAQPGDPPACKDGADWTNGDCLLLSADVIGELARATSPPNGEVTALVEAIDWSGAWQCAFSRFEVDASVDVQISPSFGVFSPNGDGQKDTGEVLIQALEPVSAEVLVYPAEIDPDLGWQVSGPSLALAESGLALSGTGAFPWDGDALPDGRYALEFVLSDGCGLERRALSFGEIDNTAPSASIQLPAAGASLGAIVEVVGEFADRNFGLATVEYGQGGNWLPLVTHRAPAAVGTVIANWPTVGLTAGAYDLRLGARDTVFNRTEVIVPVNIGAASTLIWGLDAQPALFSPNGDGVADATAVQLGVQESGVFTLEVHDAAGMPVATLGADRALAPGTHRFVWTGTGAGAPLADGRYAVVVTARDGGGTLVQVETISVGVDTTAPELNILRPAGEFERAAGFGFIEVDDLNLTAATAWIMRLDPAGSRDQVLAANRPGRHPAGDLAALPAGRYELHARAEDAAGNVSEARREFRIDARPPLVRIDAPTPGALLGGMPVTVSGLVEDDHLAEYRVQFRPAGAGENWQPVAMAGQAPASAVLAVWTPPPGDGSYDLRLLASDRAGWESEALVTVTVDQTPPRALIAVPTGDELIGRGAPILGTATDEHFASYRLRATAAGTSLWNDLALATAAVDAGLLYEWHALPPDGRYRLQLLVTDQVGLTATAEVAIVIDATPPAAPAGLTARISAPATVELQWQASTSADVQAYLVYRDGALLTEVAGSTTAHLDGPVPDGEHRYRVAARDAAGNLSPPSEPAVTTIDLTPPEVALIAPLSEERVRAVVDIVGTAASADDFFEYRLYVRREADAAPGDLLVSSPSAVAGEVLFRWDTAGVAQESAHVLLLEAEDTRTNIAAVARRIVVDNVPPAAPRGLIVIAQGADGAEVSWSPNAESDLAGYLLYRDARLVNGGEPLSEDLRGYALAATSYLDGPVADGVHAYHLRAIDLAGNVSAPSDPVSLEVETGPPTVVFAEPEAGRRFEAPLYILATGEDRDIARVQFEYRAATGPWVALGTPDPGPPFEALLDARDRGLSFGPLTLRATATDSRDQSDPAPPEIGVEYADLTPPAAVAGAGLQVTGGSVDIQWSAASEADLAGYVVTRTLAGSPPQEFNVTPSPDPSISATGLADGLYQFAIFAEDTAGNRSDAVTLPATVHTLQIEQPFTPTPVPSVTVAGSSLVPGSVAIQLTHGEGSFDLGPLATDPDGGFALAAASLVAGINTFTLELTDAAGNRSKTSTVYVQHSLPPAAPGDVTAVANGFQVDLSWSPPPGAVFGYRPFRDGTPLLADGPVGDSPLPTASSNQALATRAMDANPFSYWYPDDLDLAGSDPTIEFTFPAPRLLTAVSVQWIREFNFDLGIEVSYRPLSYQLQAWSGLVWVTLGGRDGGDGALDTLAPDQPYLTDRVRLVSRDHRTELFRPLRLAEVGFSHRPLSTAAAFQETLADGNYEYRVAAVNEHGFQGPLSAPAPVVVGDVIAPDAVVLSGSLAGRDALLSWTASSAPDVVEYRLFRNGEPILLRRDLADRAYTDADIPNGTHAYQLVAVDAVGNAGAPSNTVVLIVEEPLPEAPSQLTATAVAGGGAVDLTWLPPAAGAAGYRVKRAEQSGGPYAPIAEPVATQFQDTGVVNGVAYYYVVTAVDAAGIESAPSNEETATPHDDAAPLAPVILFPTVAGEPLSLPSLLTAVAGTAQPDSLVEVSVNGVVAAAGIAHDRLSAARVFLGDFPGQQLSPAGPQVVRSDAPDRLHDLESGQSRQLPSSFADGFFWSPGGEALFIKSGFNPATLTRFDLNSGADQLVLSWTNIDFVSAAPDARTLLVQGTHADPVSGDSVRGLWIVAASGAVSRIGDFTNPDPFIEPGSASWSPRGDLVALVFGEGFPDPYSLWVYGLADGSLTLIHADVDPNQSTTWRPDGSAIAFVDRARVVTTVSPDGALLTPISAGGAHRPRWSPGGRYLAYGQGCCELLVHDVAGVEPEHSLMLDPSPGRNWMPSGRMLALHDDGYSVIDAPGFFFVDAVPLLPGENRISAVAMEDSGLYSLPSAPILVTAPSAGLADPAALAADLNVLPRAGMPGDAFRASALVRNLTPEPVASVAVQMLLFHPDGSAEVLLDTEISLPASGQQPLAVVLDPAPIATGSYRLSVFVDPLNQLAELREDNNTASVAFTVSEQLVPLLTLRTDAPSFAPGQTVTATAEVFNPGPLLSATLQVNVEDAAGFPLGWRRDYPVEALEFGARRTIAIAWEPGPVFAGQFRLEAILRDAAGVALAAAEAPVNLDRFARLAIELDSPPGAAVLGDTVPLSAEVSFVDGNAPQRGVIQWYAAEPDGRIVWQESSSLPTLLPGARTAATMQWPGAGPQVGDHLIRAEVRSENGFASASLLLNVRAPQQAGLLEGEILTPAPVAIGARFDIDYRLFNNAATALEDVPIRLELLPVGGGPPLLSAASSASLAAGAGEQRVQSWPSEALALTSYLLVLRADLSAAGGPANLVLDTATVRGVDGVAPELIVVAPRRGQIVPAEVLVRATARDRLQRVDAVTLRLDGGPEERLGQSGTGEYQRWLFALAEGDHRLELSATDNWSNRARSGEIAITVDATAPLISVSGVADEDLRNMPVTPQVTISDAHLDRTFLFLNGAPFASGQPVTAEGAYTLSAAATDLAGNRSQLSLGFTLDLTAPRVVVEQPLVGSTVTVASLPVSGTTEAGATVTLNSGAHQAETVADAAGAFLLAAVPLSLGGNELRLSAVDPAGNAGPEIPVAVTRLAPNPQISGLLDAPASAPAGQDLDFSYRLDNAAAAGQIAARVRLLAAAAEIAIAGAQVEMPANDSVSLSGSFAGDFLRPALHRLELQVEVAGSWETLDTSAVSILDLSAPAVTSAAPADGALVAADFAVAATVGDQFGVVTSVEYALDQGIWQAMALVDPAASVYGAAAAGVSHGERRLDLRAGDDSGNLSIPVTSQFEVDARPPVIRITGVADGDLVNHALRPQVDVQDDHPDELTATLNGAPYTSGSEVTGDGDYQLAVAAVDAVGNGADASIRFAIDTVAPLIEVLSPADGDQLAQPAVSVLGTSEPLSQVTVVVAASTLSVYANSAGTFRFDGVPLAIGANALTLNATDRAGNRSPDTVINLRRVDLGAVRGELTPLEGAPAIGRPLAISYRLFNDGAGSIVALRSRVVIVQTNDGARRAEASRTQDLAGGDSMLLGAQFATDTWQAGSHRIELQASLDGQTWTTLDTSLVDIAAGVSALTINVLFPPAGSVIASGITDVYGDTLPGAGVTLDNPGAASKGSFNATVIADGSGRYRFVAVPIHPGSNTLTLTATVGIESATITLGISGPATPIPILRDWRWALALMLLLAGAAAHRRLAYREGN